MSVHVVIPVRDQVSLTASVCEQLGDQAGWETCWIFDNGSTDGTAEYLARLTARDPRFRRVWAPEWGIYQMWGQGLIFASGHGADRVLFLNNDVILAPGTVDALTVALDADPLNWLAYPDYDLPAEGGYFPALRTTAGTYRSGGMCGFAFMLEVAPVVWEPLIDPRFGWWCGDDDLAFTVEAMGGRQVRVEGLGITHLNEATARLYPELHEQKARDLALCVEKWGR